MKKKKDNIKAFVLDTNVLIHDPQAIFSFADNKVVIPMTVIEELDQFKKTSDERGRNVRTVSRILDSLRKRGKISEGIKLDSGGILKVELDQEVQLPYNFLSSKADHRILGVALSLQNKGEKIIFVSKDINLRIKAEALGLVAQDYEKEKVKLEELYNGWREVVISTKDFESFYKNKYLELKKVVGQKGEVFPNEFFILKDSANSSKSAIAKYSKKDNILVPLFHQNPQPWGLKPLNAQQRFAMELLLCNEITLVTLIGIAGAGKTLLSLACGLQKVVEEKQFRHLLVARPVVPMGRDIGFLPGTKEEKLSSWMGAIYDNLDFLIDRAKPDTSIEETVKYLFDSGLIEVEALTFLRGRSLPQQYFIIDDAQNLTPHEIKTIISRAGEGTKVVLTGDPYQIDNPYLDATSSGLTYLVECFKGQEIFGHINFTRSERSNLASLAAELL